MLEGVEIIDRDTELLILDSELAQGYGIARYLPVIFLRGLMIRSLLLVGYFVQPRLANNISVKGALE
ncbi:hypothetical protein EU510_07520 [Pseudoalteromonas sp. FUC4]|uniref:hypothetical protein n=1 Tax=Pseudoalteromonas sp. FUC4 TaxID=2511201 RepID=UPI0011F34AC2|nr:hypothetical protein [Pseudoalteromonas sp. FUC4]KAA1153640.1 hypothetical protein EU510_07520 [Pseudoalteromonas sp. FUC4]